MAATVEILLSHASDDFNAFVSRSLSATYYCRDVGVATGLRLQACFVLASEDAIVGSLDEGSVELGSESLSLSLIINIAPIIHVHVCVIMTCKAKRIHPKFRIFRLNRSSTF